MPVSRLQRDLTDSTLTRNIGSIFGYFLIACESILTGMTKLDINESQIHKDLENNPIVIAEAIQTILRREYYNNPYEKLKELTQIKMLPIMIYVYLLINLIFLQLLKVN